MISVSVSTIRAMVRAGALRALRTPGGHRRIPLESLEALLSARLTLDAVSTLPVLPDVSDDRPTLSILLVGSTHAPEGSCAAFSPLDVRCHRAADGLDALILAARVRPDMLVTDHALGSMDGFELVRRLRRYPEFSDMIAVIVAPGDGTAVLEGDPGLSGVLVLREPARIDRLSGLVDALRLNRARAGTATDRHRTQFGAGQ